MLALTPAVIWLMYGYFAPAANPDGLITAARAELAAEQQAAKVAATVRAMTGSKVVTSVRQAAALCSVSRYIVLGWIGRGLLPEPSWTLGQLQQAQEAAGPRTAPHTPHGTRARWSHGCSCTECRRAHADTLRVSWTGESARAASRHRPAAAPRCNLCWPTVQECNLGPWP
jgi:hypothetical protein